jgi:hypothetical protein
MIEESVFSTKSLNLLPVSTRRGIQKLEYDFLKMKHSTFSDEQLVSQIEESIKTFALMLDDAVCSDGDSSLLINQLKSIEDCIEFISNAITNRLQSGRFLYEANLFNPHNMGSFSELYSFYESFVDLLQRIIIAYNQKRDDDDKISRLSFLVDISTHSSVSAQLFLPVTCERIPRNRLVGITINETAFFQIRNTVIFLLHEIGHYVRPYKRKKRNIVVLDILINWISHAAANEMVMYLQTEVPLAFEDLEEKNERKNIEILKEHFEEALISKIVPVLNDALRDSFEQFIVTDGTKVAYGDRNLYVDTLHVFHDLLNSFLTDLSTHLSDLLFWRDISGTKTGLKEIITDKLALKMPTRTKKHQKKPNLFAYLCQSATELFDDGNIFEYKPGAGISHPNVAFKAYLRSLSLLGLNEYSPKNLDLFVSVLMKCLKKSIEATIENSILDMFITGLDESLANLFWIRMLKVSDFEDYWKIEKSLIDQSVFNENARIRFFGIPNAIITEYFDLLQSPTPSEEQHYKIPPIDFSMFGDNKEIYSPQHQQRVLDDMRFILFVPVAEFLQDEVSVFPEEYLFQVEKNTPLSSDGKQVLMIREAFQKYLIKTKRNSGFENEISLIHFFG